MDLDHRDLYRLPWNVEDNVLAWLAPGEQPIERVAADLGALARVRRFDGLILAAAAHPRLADAVRLAASRGYKVVLETDGLGLDEPLLRALKQAGLAGVTFAIDSLQGRAGWRDATELDLNELRLRFAELAGRVGGLHCGFRATVSASTLRHLPELVQWAQDHIELVHEMVFVAAREPADGFDYYAGAARVDRPARKQRPLTSVEMVARIEERFPDFMPAAYLGGSERPEALKWLAAGRIGTSERISGYVGPKAMEMAQTLHHALFGRYLALARPSLLALGRLAMTAGALVDRGARGALASWLRSGAHDPLSLLDPQHYQSIVIIQPIDVLPDGRQNMCDGCPEITAHGSGLLWSCRLHEVHRYGSLLRTVPKPAPRLQEREACAPLH